MGQHTYAACPGYVVKVASSTLGLVVDLLAAQASTDRLFQFPSRDFPCDIFTVFAACWPR